MWVWWVTVGDGVCGGQVLKVSKEERLVAIKLVTGASTKGKGMVEQDAVTAGGAVKMSTAGEAKVEEAKEEKREMEV